MMKLENLELVDVQYENEGKKAVLTFLDEDRSEIREVNFNKQDYKDGSFVDSDEKAEKVEKWCDDFFGLTFDRLPEAIGERKTVYAYERFNSLFETTEIKKYDEDMLGQLLEVVVSDVIDDGIAIRIRWEDDGNTYESKMSYSDYLKAKGEWFVNPQKRIKQYEKFQKKFGFPVEEKEKLIGKTVIVEVKKAMGKYIYAEVKPLQTGQTKKKGNK